MDETLLFDEHTYTCNGVVLCVISVQRRADEVVTRPRRAAHGSGLDACRHRRPYPVCALAVFYTVLLNSLNKRYKNQYLCEN